MSENRITIRIPADLYMVRTAAAALRGVLAEWAGEPEQISSIELCLVEAMTNIVKHAYRGQPGGSLELELNSGHGRLEIVLRDHGCEMPDGALERARAGRDAPIDVPRENGYGLGIIVELMDAVRYQRSNDTNTLTMTTSLGRSSP